MILRYVVNRLLLMIPTLIAISIIVFTIGVVTQTPQPVVVSNALRNVPVVGFYGWDPGAYFGIYHPDTFWIDPKARP